MKRTTLTILIALGIVLAGIGGFVLFHDVGEPDSRIETTAAADPGNSAASDPSGAPDGESSETDSSGADDSKGGENSGSGAEAGSGTAALAFASDYQEEEGFPAPADTMKGLASAVSADHPRLDGFLFCGDYTNAEGLWNYQLSGEDSIAQIREIITGTWPDMAAERLLFIQGNHDAKTSSIASSGLHEYDNYLVYVLNTENDFPWSQGKTSGCLNKVKKSSADMKKCFDGLIDRGERRPVFIAAHVPLHFTARTSSLHSTGDNLYASLLFDVINKAGEEPDLIYLFGHNHSKGWDSYMGGGSVFKAPGETILIPEFGDNAVNTDRFNEEALTFTYLNAGYTGYISDTSSDTTLTATVCQIDPDRLTFSRYDSDGLHSIRETGAANPYKDDTGLIPSEFYSTRLDSPADVPRRAGEARP